MIFTHCAFSSVTNDIGGGNQLFPWKITPYYAHLNTRAFTSLWTKNENVSFTDLLKWATGGLHTKLSDAGHSAVFENLKVSFYTISSEASNVCFHFTHFWRKNSKIYQKLVNVLFSHFWRENSNIWNIKIKHYLHNKRYLNFRAKTLNFKIFCFNFSSLLAQKFKYLK